MNFKYSKTSDSHRLLLSLTDKYVALLNLSIYCKWRNIKKSYKNNKFKISAPTKNEEFKLPNGSYYYQISKFILNSLFYLKNIWRKR